MKKGFTIMTLLVVMPLILLSQDFKGGLSAGLSATQIDGESQAGYNKVGFVFGGYVKRKFTEKINGQFEIKYIDKGSHQSNNPNGSDWTIKLKYIEMPFLATYTLKELYTFEGGVGLAYLIHYAYNDGSGNVNNSDVPYRHFDYNFIAGFNYKLSERFSATVRYNYSIISILKEHLNTTSWYYNNFNKGQFNNVLSFTLNCQL